MVDTKTAVEMLLNRCSASFKGDYINLFSVEETKFIADFIEQQEKEIIRLKSKVREFIHPLDVAELEKYAELGRLAESVVKNSMEYRAMCNKKYANYDDVEVLKILGKALDESIQEYQKRAELLANKKD